MKGTSILNFKPWRKIHPPLPRTPRESQQLLNALTSSFRRQLDQAYPPLDQAQQNNNEKDARDSETSAHAADKHLQSILDNPLFKVVPSQTIFSSVSKSDTQSRRALQKRLAKEPMVVFDELVASGHVEVTSLVDCLKAQLYLTGSGDGAREAMKSSGAGKRLVSWFWASDPSSRKLLFKSRNATSTALKFMVAEDLQDTVMVWLRMLGKNDLGGVDGQIPQAVVPRVFKSFLSDFIAAEVRYGRGVVSALDYYLQAFRMCSFSISPSTPDSRNTMLVAAATQLAHWIVDNAQGQAIKDIPASLYQQFCEAISTITTRPFLSASAWLYNPTNPDARPLLEYAKSVPSHIYSSWKEPRKEIFLKVSLDAVRFMMERKEFRDATWLVQHVKQLLSDEQSAVKETKESRSRSSQEVMLHHLDLALA
ncbi:hypothetical protein C8Q69DRAFT_241781 [Paecilomyces variotii]|uniref:Uncharacterized protein n=1 Tax=Byssochlamys spectabilis TaxID=264951 RepID=A0A443HX99_BYSSP|nr:hypothetical protein C8Q69DRAFT_241781 [Paecilomyces variotii]KAJ9361402.1 hypothetical protein DTO280E4_3876 [Paecilomyces variotii]RWQ96361.1 hypothetical protein C8Q69DRAFT_241781 [Paecilomyces variotii]